ncbi:MAG: hypothetical protein M1824_002840 [Vezdaea acicularis]|nr:MAG: hypothetical protein M1824_002840 [Vezdaea acicularis]
MAFLFGRNKQKSTADLPRLAKDLIARLDQPAKAEELGRVMSQMKATLSGTADTDSSPETIAALVANILSEDLLIILARNLYRFPFEARKDTQTIFSYTLRHNPTQTQEGEPSAGLTYVVKKRPETIIELCMQYEHADKGMLAGGVLRELLKVEPVAEIILMDEPGLGGRLGGWNHDVPRTGKGVFWRFFEWIDESSFEVSADAFSTFREILTRHKHLVGTFLTTNFDRFFHHYNNTLLQSKSYVTKRQSIKLLGELLLDRSNYAVMTTYVDKGDNLKICMKLLKDNRRMVQYEGFHVFKVFVANPHKSLAVQKILITNRTRLLAFLPGFLDERTDDEQFLDERAFLIRQIENLPEHPVDMGRPGGSVAGGGSGSGSGSAAGDGGAVASAGAGGVGG